VPKGRGGFRDEAEKPVHVLVLIDVPIAFLEVKRMGGDVRTSEPIHRAGNGAARAHPHSTRRRCQSKTPACVPGATRVFGGSLPSVLDGIQDVVPPQSAAAAGTSSHDEQALRTRSGRLLNCREAMCRKRHWPVL